MALRIFTSIALVGALGILPACGDDTGTTENGSTSNNPTNGTEPTGGSTADEPTGALDSTTSHEVMELLKSVNS